MTGPPTVARRTAGTETPLSRPELASVECPTEAHLQRQNDGAISFTIGAFSRGATLPAQLGGPATRWIQDVITKRYLTALDRLGA